MLEAEILDTNGMLEANIDEARATKELFYVNINETATQADKTSTEIFEASQADKYVVGIYFNNNAFNIVPFVLIQEDIAQCQILFDTDVVQIAVDNTGAVTVRNISLAETSDIPTQTSQLTNDSGFITNAVNDLANYYLKSETYTKDEVQQLIAQIPSMSVVVVQSLPVSGEELTIYLVPRNPGELNNIYDEYMWLSSGWEKIGSTDIDLTDYVKFTDYATSSKGGVIKKSSSYGTDVTGSGILTAEEKGYNAYQSASNYMFIGKGTLENVIAGKELVNKTTLEESQALQDEVIEENTKDIEYTQTLSNLFEKSTGTATELTLNNTEDTQLKIGLKGNTYQETTEGKNLLDLKGYITSRGATYTENSDGSILVAPGGTLYSQPYQFSESDINVSLSGLITEVTATNVRIQLLNSSNNVVGEITNSSPTLLNKTASKLRLNYTTAGTYTLSNIMLNEGATTLPYEPFTGNQPAPSPDYPQDIQVVTGDNQIDISNKNLFEDSVLNQYKVSEDSEAYIFNNNTLYNKNLTPNITFKENTSYAIQYIAKQVGTGNPRLAIQYTDGTQEQIQGDTFISTTYTQYTKVSNPSKTIDYITSGYGSNASQGFYIKKNSVMIEKSSTATEYTPHKEQNYPISLGDIELCKIGDYQDYIHKDSGKWYVHKAIGKVVLNGSENWAYNDANQVFVVSDLVNYLRSGFVPYCDNFIGKNTDYYGGYANNEIGFLRSENQNRLVIKYLDYSSSATFKTWLSTHNTEVYYVLATPTETEITDTTLISQLNNLEYAMAYKEQTNINQVNDDMPFELSYETFKPIRDVNSYAGIIVPDTTNMTPIKTVEYDVSSNAYYKFMSVANDFTSMDDQYGDCLFRITVTGTNIAKNIIEGIYSVRQGENAVPYFAVRNNAGEGTTNSAITGIRYIRVNYPKTMNNGYDYDLEFNCINSNTRHIKIEVFKTTPNITWYDSLTSTTFNSTYQTTTSLTISTTNVINVLGSYTMTVSNATVASYINSYLPKFLSGTLPSAGQAISAQQFIFISDDNKAYPSSNKTKPIKTGIGIQLCSNNVSVNSAVTNTGLRQKYNNSTLTNIPHATLTAGDECWFRCTMDANGNILSDNYVATERTSGYTWYFVGIATSANAINVDTTQSKFYTLDANGKLTHIDGLEIA